jgi:hypothetical protein
MVKNHGREFEMSRSTSAAYGHLRNAAWHYLSIDDDGGDGVLTPSCGHGWRWPRCGR